MPLPKPTYFTTSSQKEKHDQALQKFLSEKKPDVVLCVAGTNVSFPAWRATNVNLPPDLAPEFPMVNYFDLKQQPKPMAMRARISADTRKQLQPYNVQLMVNAPPTQPGARFLVVAQSR